MVGSSPGVLGCTMVLVGRVASAPATMVLVTMVSMVSRVASVPVNCTNGTFGQLYTHTVGFQQSLCAFVFCS